MLTALRMLLGFLGLSAVLICLSIMLLGPQRTAWQAEAVFDALARSSAGLSEPWPPTMDSELRFYAPFWGAYGIILIAVARSLPRRAEWVPWLALLFFVGGIGRIISIAAVGLPHPFFVMLMVIKLVLPPVFIVLWRVALPVS
jgi:hypothetical protein